MLVLATFEKRLRTCTKMHRKIQWEHFGETQTQCLYMESLQLH